jgi:PIN domain nuclease of toxin-antitoxin system
VRVLLDTHVLLWWLADDQRLAVAHRDLLAEPSHEVRFSAVSIAEIAVKASRGKLDAPEGAELVLEEDGFLPLPLTAEHAAALRRLPWHHRDPFDRMLVAQAQVEGMAVATVDPRFAAYGVRVV